ncbi:Serine/threonine-protein kinase 32A [Aspergillus tanneri]|uniref:non-specific serine/threonine protein kinase n=1 Tax=Aspergillus tanneri TaxID=1220188 RepID=A0A5M9MBW9_9EURO|nr:Serine/threonine-protein kinase 32A [Aspergillus tanneri]KAA8644532.1 Serine/threonine-protein kinase 32A [Aspergillus tanneri]
MGNTQGKPVCSTDEVNLNQFRLLRVVGKGAFGKVRIVEKKDTGLTFALKYIRKEEGIIHRDVKPDNVLLDSEGHVHLADFNVASDFRPGKPLTSKSGTLAYLAPEVYEGGGYYCEVDWWSLGVTFYECIYNKRPFEGRSQDTLSENIKKAQPKYFVTNPAVSVPCLRAMASFMEKDRSKRIGAISFESFTSHPFFAEIDFVALERKEIPPVFTPSSDKTNFDATYDLEELLLEEAPLEARARRQKPRAELREDATAKEIREDELHRLIETMFEPFDYTTVNFRANAAEVIAATTNPEDCLPADSTHSRQYSQHDSRNDGSVGRLTQTETPSPAGGTPEPQDPTSASNKTPMFPTTQPMQAPPPPPTAPSFSRPLPPPSRTRGATRKTSKGGGVQMVLEEAGSWSELADHSSTLPAEGYDTATAKGKSSNSGMLAFLSRKKGRDRSPKPQEPGVLGKEGARQIISG